MRRSYVDIAVNHARDAEGTAATVAAIESDGATAISIRADFSQAGDIVDMFEAVDRRFGAPYGLVNDYSIVGVSEPDGAVIRLVSAQASYIHGAILNVSGGR